MYYENHVTLEQSESYHTDHGRRMEWHCFLCGERVGTIEYFSNPCTWEKHYESLVYCDNQRMKHVGWHDSLYAAKCALLEPAREYLRELRAEAEQTKVAAAALPESDCGFYPTPPEIAGKLLSGVNWDHVESILEPSAGRGDLIEYALRRNGSSRNHRYSRRDLDDIDCVEIDSNLRAILIGKFFQ